VLDVSGRRVRILVDELRPAGRHRARWDGRDHDGRPVADGVYFLRLAAAGEVVTGKVAKLR
jgi:flagellar hook assembly protein FlgD